MSAYDLSKVTLTVGGEEAAFADLDYASVERALRYFVPRYQRLPYRPERARPSRSTSSTPSRLGGSPCNAPRTGASCLSPGEGGVVP